MGRDKAFTLFKSKFNITNEQETYLNIGNYILTQFIVTTDLLKLNVESYYDKGIKTKNFYVLTESGYKFKNDNRFYVGLKFPLVVKPKLWLRSSNSFGGFKKADSQFIPSLIHKSVQNSGSSIILNDHIYNQVNYQNSVPFRINKLLYDFIISNGFNLNLLLSSPYNADALKIFKKLFIKSLTLMILS